jgi:hypothetical protein
MRKRPKLLKMPRQRGIPTDRDELKIRRGLMITPKAWDGLAVIAKRLGYKSKSDLIEAIGREELKMEKIKPQDFKSEQND